MSHSRTGCLSFTPFARDFFIRPLNPRKTSKRDIRVVWLPVNINSDIETKMPNCLAQFVVLTLVYQVLLTPSSFDILELSNRTDSQEGHLNRKKS